MAAEEVLKSINLLAEQERELHFTSFDADSAWELGRRLRALAGERAKPVAIGIWMSGQTLFYSATTKPGMLGVTPGNEDWLRRKRNTVLRYGKSSLRVGLELERDGTTLEQRQGLELAKYAAHGGGFPLILAGSGCVGAVVASGLPQREDHDLVVAGIAEVLGGGRAPQLLAALRQGA